MSPVNMRVFSRHNPSLGTEVINARLLAVRANLSEADLMHHLAVQTGGTVSLRNPHRIHGDAGLHERLRVVRCDRSGLWGAPTGASGW